MRTKIIAAAILMVMAQVAVAAPVNPMNLSNVGASETAQAYKVADCSIRGNHCNLDTKKTNRDAKTPSIQLDSVSQAYQIADCSIRGNHCSQLDNAAQAQSQTYQIADCSIRGNHCNTDDKKINHVA